jgi:hypothetical protein
MTEAEWLASADPTPMFEYLQAQDTASERKLRLFAAACCRRRWDWLGEKSRRAIEVLERYLDGLATADQLYAAAGVAYDDWIEEFGTHYPSNAAVCALSFENVSHLDAARGAAAAIAEAVRLEASRRKAISLQAWAPAPVQKQDPAIRQVCIDAGEMDRSAERTAQCDLLRDIFHGPRRAVYFRAHWRNNTITNLATAISSGARLETLPILADALEEAGCADTDILGHCRSEGPHVRGCWAVDLILGKN